MLNLASDQLSHDWEIVTSGSAELYIYSLESEEGVTAWQHHDSHALSALLSTHSESNHTADILLKKPLRTKNFSITLNDAEDKIKNDSEAVNTKNKQQKDPSLFSSVLSSLSGIIGKNSSFTKPTLHFSLPEQSTDSTDSILEVKPLKKWLAELESKEAHIQIGDILGNLIPLNRRVVAIQTRFKAMLTI